MASKNVAAHECVSEEALAHLKKYQYSGVDKSYLSRYLLRHYWNAFVELLPLWLAPNMVTLIGFFFILFDVALVAFFIPDLVGPGPSWLYYCFAFGLWMYSTMDNVDGKQARRTGTSSGLGELFDHGIDSLNCTLASLLETAAMGLGASKTGAFTAMVPCLPMFFSTWETYHTHTLYLGYFNGPTEGLILACSVMIISGYYGPHVWQMPLGSLFSLPDYLKPLESYTPRNLWPTMILVTFFVAHLPSCIVNVAKARRAQKLPVLPVFLDWVPMLIYISSTCAWLYSPYSIVLRDNHLLLFCVTQSFVFGRMTTKIILAHLTRQPFPYWTVLIAPLVGGALMANAPRIGCQRVEPRIELWYLYAYFVVALVVYFRWALLVINAICNYLQINCLTIPRQGEKKKGQAVANGKLH